MDHPNPIAADHTGEEVAYPRTAILGAVRLTGYFGGATTSHMIDEQSLSATFSCLSPFGIAVWAGLWLRSATVRSIMPLVR